VPRSNRSNVASRIADLASELGIDREQIAAWRIETTPRPSSSDELRAMCAARMAPPVEPVVEEPVETPKPRKAGLTLSQRRALLRLLDEDAIVPAYKALPFEHPAVVGYPEPHDEGAYRLTAEGVERAETINPGYRVWASGETVAGDRSRPVAGTHRDRKARRAAGQDEVRQYAGMRG
jgi:hypothetical protein